jgi:glycosyltransferase involved in cell wall biosynthesis
MVRFFDSGDEASMARAMLEVLQDDALRERLIEGGLAHASAQRWGRHRSRYLELVDGLVASRPAPSPRWKEA